MSKKIPDIVPLREMKIWQSDDGRRIEVFSKKKEVKYIHRPQEVNEGEVPEFNAQDVIYVGCAQIGTPVGFKEIKFEIVAESLEEAFEKYHEYATAAADSLRKQIEELREKQQSSIVPASSVDLEAIDAIARQSEDRSIIIP